MRARRHGRVRWRRGRRVGDAGEWSHRRADWWRPTRTLTTWLTWLFAVQAVAQLANVFAVDNAECTCAGTARSTRCSTGATRPRSASSTGTRASRAAGARCSAFVAIAALVLHIIWTWRSAHNARRPRSDRRAPRVPGGPSVRGSSRSPTSCSSTSSSPICGAVPIPTVSRGDGWRRLPDRSWCGSGSWRTSGGLGVLVRRDRPRGERRHRRRDHSLLLVVAGVVGAAGTVLLDRRGPRDHGPPGSAAGARPRAARAPTRPPVHPARRGRRPGLVRRPERSLRASATGTAPRGPST